MQHWLKPWRAWVFRDIWPRLRRQALPGVLSLSVGWEKNGHVVRHEPAPWNADAVLVDVLLQMPAELPCRKQDFAVVRPDQAAFGPTACYPSSSGALQVTFRLPPPPASEVVELVWQQEPLAHAAVTLLSQDQFLDRLLVKQPTLAITLGEQTVDTAACLLRQARGLLAAGLLSSPTCLAPLADLELAIELIDLKASVPQRLMVKLSAAQLHQKEALLQAYWPKPPRRLGRYAVQWLAGGRVLAWRELLVLSQRQLLKQLFVTASYYVFKPLTGGTELLRQPPTQGVGWLGPCFLLRSRLPGLAALVPLSVWVCFADGRAPELLAAEDFLVTEGPCPFLAQLVATQELSQISAFELRLDHHTLARLSTVSAPVARFTGEGGFEPITVDYPWSPAADAELADRLGKLLE